MPPKKTHAQYLEELAIKSPHIEPVEEYINSATKILHHCKRCDYKWEIRPNDILKRGKCPICDSNRRIGPAPLYANSIWASEYKEVFAKYMTEDQMKTTMPKSHIKIDMVCPDCGRHKEQTPKCLIYQGFGCVCSDGLSYPNKFVYAVLNQLNIVYEMEKTFDWSENKRYDIYIPHLNCIIENHGQQHYTGWCNNKDDLERNQINDLYKKEIAMSNGISTYVELDCRKSAMEWIKNSILTSPLIELLDFSLIDWEECNDFAISSFVKKAANLWNERKTIQEISQNLHITPVTVYEYLKKATDTNLCDYTPEESMRRGKTLISGERNWNSEPFIQFTLDGEYIKEWQCQMDVERELNISSTTISSVLNHGDKKSAGGFLWMWKKEYDKIGKCNPYIKKTTAKPVLQLSLDGEIIKEWPGATTAGNALKIDISSICKCCKGKLKKTGGFLWKYPNET
jgi:AraC-like DNA-binding protein